MINNNISVPKKVINLFISYMLSPCLRNLNTYFTLNNYFLKVSLKLFSVDFNPIDTNAILE